MEIEQLIYLISQDDQKAFESFYHHYYEQIFRFCFYLLKEKEACREVVSNVFFSAWQSRKKLPEVRNMETYLYVATRNEVNRYLSQSSGFRETSLGEIPMQYEASDDPSPEEELQRKELSGLISRFVSELPERCRVIFLLTHQDGLKPKEIAEILSISESTIRVQLKIALEKIANQLRPYFPQLGLLILLLLNIVK
ncbi:RNA polymerase sigma factor [Parabacteroides sp. Marseille-P3160]|uniref:RNA polymerase sigma factor n=1 Tax=Parabacteroides sp. Marseille-P3160 TaxID=1917887 RepID=UPI0009BB6C04|nr:RNA polymerase sigma-70 factor [Parabacteroides sp. Marseille-P3160]